MALDQRGGAALPVASVAADVRQALSARVAASAAVRIVRKWKAFAGEVTAPIRAIGHDGADGQRAQKIVLTTKSWLLTIYYVENLFL
jgi:hypothetical protein